jgi:uncharacterized protein YkwD
MERARRFLLDHGEAVVRWVIGVLAAALLVIPTAAADGMTRSESSLLQQMNTVRAAHGLPMLQPDDKLEQAARAHTQDMISTDSFSHGAFATRLVQFGITASISGENLAYGGGPYATPQRIVAMWLRSPEHRANLLRGSFTHVGIGSAVASFQGYARVRVVTVDFSS